MSFFVQLAVAGLIVLAGTATAEEIHNYRMCRNTKCDVYDVEINPCPEAQDNKPCEIPQGINASITFKYNTSFSSNLPKTRLYAETLLIDLPFLDMNTNACLYTSCPLVEKVVKTWTYNLYIAQAYPKGSYTVKMKMWNGDSKYDNQYNECCFKFNMAIV